MEKSKIGIALLFLFLIAGNYIVRSQGITFSYDGIPRSYLIHVPANYTGNDPVPLVLNFHGLGSNKEQQFFYTRFDLIADTAGFILVVPDGVNNSWNIGLPGPFHEGTDDVGFTNALLDSVMNQYNIDRSRVYSTGMSNGGFFSYRLACEMEDRIAAVASVTGSMTDSMQYYCPYVRDFPVLQIHGTADSVVHFQGTSFSKSIDDLMAFWVVRNQSNPKTFHNYPNLVLSDSCTVSHFRWGVPGNQDEVMLYTVHDGGHTWPGAINIPSLGHTNQDINASIEIWNFFRRHHHPSLMGIEQSMENTQVAPLLFPNPANSDFTLMHAACEQFEVYDIRGKRLGLLTSDNGGTRFTIPDFMPAGIYILTGKANEKVLRLKLVVTGS